MTYEEGRPDESEAAHQSEAAQPADAEYTAADPAVCEGIRRFLAVIYGGGVGFCHVVYAADWYVDDTDKVINRVWSETIGKRCARPYPAETDEIIGAIVAIDEAGYDAYVCTSLVTTRSSRAKENVASHWCLHADCDKGVDLDLVRQLGGCAVSSGTPDHAHVYFPLSHPVTEAQFEALEEVLVARFNADAKKVANDVLRPPGTHNYKATARGGEPTRVEWVVP